MKTTRFLRTLTVAAGLALGIAAQAAPIIRLSDGTNSLDIGNTAGAVAALDSSAGDLTYVGTLGNHWMLSLTSSPGWLNYTINASNLGAGGTFLDVALSDNNFSMSDVEGIARFIGDIQGQTQGLVTWWMFIDDGNNLFAQTTQIGNGTNASAGFNSQFDAIRSVDGTFSMTLLVRINHGNSERLTSLDFSGLARVLQVPEPGTLLLLAAGLFGVALGRRRAR